MNLKNVIKNEKKNLMHGNHGGEIFKFNSKKNLDSLMDFSTNINHLVTPNMLLSAYKDALNQVSMYPDSNSTLLKEELVRYFNNTITKDNLIVGAGSMDLISTFCDMFIDTADDVIIIQPTFSEYAWGIEKNGGTIINSYRTSENDFYIEHESIINNFTHRTKAIFICNPNNPNGVLDNSKELEKIIRLASKNDIIVFLDEAFIEFADESNSFINNILSFDNLFICRTFTKFFGLTGLRIGFGVSSPKIINYMKRGQKLWPVNCFGQVFALKMLKLKKFTEDSLQFFSIEREFIKKKLLEIPRLKIFPTNTNFFLINTENIGIKSNLIKELLIEENILIRDCSNFEGLNDYYIRFSIKNRDMNIKLINALKKIVNRI
ncbi:MAG: histidinol-phosphate aminotransferase family protein [Candidatus Lokiarchaeota archaeon]|nr:histidinol-phosphate aminotransferase family protein [Candidatus Lokiarchaeota archaeon]